MTQKILWLFFAILSIGLNACNEENEEQMKKDEETQYSELINHSFQYDWNSSKNCSYIINFKNDTVFEIYTFNNDNNRIFNDKTFDGTYITEIKEQNIDLTFNGVNSKWDGDKYFTIKNGWYNRKTQELNIYMQ